MGATPDSPEGERLDVLVTLVEAYERPQTVLTKPIPSCCRPLAAVARV